MTNDMRRSLPALLGALIAYTPLAYALDADPPTTGRLGYWSFEQVSGTTVFDAGNTNTANAAKLNNPLSAGANWVAGPTSGSTGLFLDTLANNANRQNYLQLPATLENAAFPTSGTLAFWIKGDFSAQGSRPVFDTYYSTRNHLFIRTANGNALQIALQSGSNFLGVNPTFAPGYTSPTSIPVAANVWTHLAVTWDSTNKMTSIYKDGAKIVSYFWGAGYANWKPDGQLLRFGAVDNGAVGNFDNIALYNRVLSGAEVQALYSGTTAPAADQSPPSTPIGLAAEPSSPTMIVLGWQPAQDNNGVAGYTLYRNGTPITSLPAGATGYADTGLAADTHYDYQLFAFDQSGNRAPAAAVSTQTLPARFLFSSTLEANPPGTIAGTAIPGWTFQAPAGSVSVTTERARAGSHAFKLDFKLADWTADLKRAEAIPYPNTSLNLTLGQVYWIGLSQYLPADFADEQMGDNEEVLWQFHGAQNGPGGISAPLALYLSNNKARVTVLPAQFVDGKIVELSANPNKYENIWTGSTSSLKGKWTDWVIQVKFDYINGSVKIWKDGVRVGQYSGSTIYKLSSTPNSDGKYQNNENGPYLKFGDYKWGWGARPSSVTQRVVYVDEIRQANSTASCADVLPSDAVECGIPVVSAVSMLSDSDSPSVAKAGNKVTLSFAVNQTSASAPVVTMLGRNATVTNIGNNCWRATITVNSDDPNGLVGFSATIPNLDGDASTTINSVTEGLPVLIDQSPGNQ